MAGAQSRLELHDRCTWGWVVRRRFFWNQTVRRAVGTTHDTGGISTSSACSQLQNTNQFGTQTMDVVKPDRLMVPTAKSLVETPTLPTFSIDHFKCYRVVFLKLRQTGIKVDDQFGTTTVDLKKPNHLCVPANKNSEGILDQTQLLMRYQPRITSGTPPANPPTIFTNNQFGTYEFPVFGPRDFCVPSTLQP
jgi:hypothetical protein